MDTGTHLVMGIGLAGLACIDPVVANNPSIFAAVLVGTVIGSQAPDFDTFLRLKGNASYIRNHRGISHSLPAIAIWTILITGLIQLVYRGSLPWLHVGSWVLLAVCLHVFTDLFNAYGTQAMRPFTEKWISWNIIHIFDPVIFTTHVIAILFWAFGLASPVAVFPVLYVLTIIYYTWRTLAHRSTLRRLQSLDPEPDGTQAYVAIPTISLSHWNIVKRATDGSFVIGDLRGNKLRWLDNVRCSDHPAVAKSRNDNAIRSFLYFTKFACAEVKEHPWGYEVRWSDVRYRHRKQYPFVAVLLMNKEYETVGSYVGWLSDDRLMKRLRMNSY
ncbi:MULTISPECIES: metal-dependent hydrolase [unclassified Paenibacillus]|uniref:metal-dependent hydrolase n=1 Tax=unclassified Paenibacillus TaxID=185978 RepID=UPI00104A8B54|nr:MULTISPECIES: metal-dependent hydrolase [unclassified Paenibacillus]NIK70224.1 inner membrane protein [Paenibacillus sp. BK720]TCM98051.1 inner membrane protein [Paenibacillus sp. BK033]